VNALPATNSASPIALVTGASRGIGAAIALELAKAGHHVVAVARTVGGLEELDDQIKAAGGTATLVPLDMKDMDGIARLALALNERYGKLDVLVGNAGVLGPLSPLDHVEPKYFDDAMDVNVKANWQLIRTMDALLKRAPAGRAVFVTSGVAYKGRAYWGPYAASKAALDALVRTYAREPVRARPDADADVYRRVPGRRSGHAAHTGRCGEGDAAVVSAGLRGKRKDLQLPR
jgi:NAD(P)-dependent dehydrogenase (short-subunit alcohol dehydrogenase family)